MTHGRTRWFRLDVDYFTNPKSMPPATTPTGHLASICWVGQHLTDGHIPADVVPILCRESLASNPRPYDKLVTPDCGYNTEPTIYVHDYLEYNSSRGDVERDTGESWRLRQTTTPRRTNGRFTHDRCHAVTHAECHAL